MNEKQEILKIWKEASEWQENKFTELCKEFKVNIKPVKVDAFYSIYAFENGVQFTVPHDTSYDDGELTGDALKFAEKHYQINDETYSRVDDALEKHGYEKIDSDDCFSTYLKEGYEYFVNHYADEESDIEVEKDIGQSPTTKGRGFP